MQAGMIGLGAMGIGMASNLARAGFLQGVYNRTQDKAEKWAKTLACHHYVNISELAADCDVVFLCISTDTDVLSVVEQIQQAAKPGTIVVDMSTVSVKTARKAAAVLAKKQISFLDAPVSGGVEGAKNAKLMMMVGGDEDVLDKVKPLLMAMSQRIAYMGPTGSGQATKAVNQIMAAGINQAVTEALSFGQTQGLDMDKVIDVISGGAAGNWFLQHRGPTMIKNSFKPGFKVALHHKDLTICRQMAKQQELTLPLLEKTLQDYQDLIAQGFGEEDISALYRLQQKPK
ncbi:NAD(P)-dependent oxidoreductase [methane-oxidizing endosymbiont of Gigantopelta aegis]|uniref:NAD(P)-dependent oxidoreductase n=1 Tax=methane-oxidizing endosymbiont of Gigantopelta aegis TaxID=2794938 RepID=UPI0018DDF3D8|nr:NAD(P)-dependent oxidoreductase [methane-oxidizing endosymbiont of Gigantopelta aegis]